MTIGEIGRRIIINVGVALDAHTKERRLAPLTHLVMAAQTAIYWLRLNTFIEVEDANAIVEDTPTQESVEQLNFMPPTLFSVREHLDYLNRELKVIAEELDSYTKTQITTPTTLYNIQRAYDKIHESVFNAELATNYYGQLERR